MCQAIVMLALMCGLLHLLYVRYEAWSLTYSDTAVSCVKILIVCPLLSFCASLRHWEMILKMSFWPGDSSPSSSELSSISLWVNSILAANGLSDSDPVSSPLSRLWSKSAVCIQQDGKWIWQVMSYQMLTVNSVSSRSESESESADSKSASKSSVSNSISWVPSNGRSQDLRSSSSGTVADNQSPLVC